MKKILCTIVMLTLLVCSLFATYAELWITCKVDAVDPDIVLFGSLTNSTASTGEGMTQGGVVVTKKTSTVVVSPADNAIISGDVVLYCVIRQANNGVKSLHSYTLSAEASPFEDGTGTAGHASAAPVVSDITAITGNNIAGARTCSDGGGLSYSGMLAGAADLAHFNVTWPQTDMIPGITYSAYVTLTITTV